MSIQAIIEVKDNNKWSVTHTITDKGEVYERLANDLISKKICACRYIRSIKRVQLYTGFVHIIVCYDNNCRCTYTVADH